MDFATEKGYIEAVSRGDEQAFESLFLHYFPRIKGFISGILQNEEEAEDISQDIFVSMWQNRDRDRESERLPVSHCQKYGIPTYRTFPVIQGLPGTTNQQCFVYLHRQ